MHGGGRAVTVAEIIPGRFRTELERLPPAAKATALTWLARMRFGDHDVADLHADAHGGIYFACDNGATEASIPRASQGFKGAALLRTPSFTTTVPIASQPSYHSRPGATNRIYLDFNGATVQNTAWNSGGIANPLICPPFDSDLAPTTFSPAEQTAILETWQRVAEDYAPFNVDVTTDPATEASLNNRTMHVVITDSSIGVAPGAGGVAYVGVFGTSFYASTYSPAFVFSNQLGPNREDLIAEACSHEIGHNVGLSHDATFADPSYYDGHGSSVTSWGPIMGTGYNRNVSQFSKGDYFDAFTANGSPSGAEDDLSIIASYLTYRPDDHGNFDSAATDISGLTLSASGIIGRTNDVDVLSFTCRTGPITLTASPWQSPQHTDGGNLDLKMGLYQATGSLVVMSAQAGNVGAAISTTVTAGTYFIRIANDGEGTPLANPASGYTPYGSLGQWTLTGTSVVSTATITATDAVASENGPGTGTFTITLSAASVTPTTVAYSVSGTATNSTDYTSIGSSIPVPANATSVTVTVIPEDDVVVERSETVIVTIINSADYLPGLIKQATVTITDNDLPSVSIATTDAQAAEASRNVGLFTVTLSAEVDQNTDIIYQIAGSAINGSDYQAVTSTVAIPANTSSATILIVPIDDTVIEDAEAVQLTLSTGSGYLLGSPTSAFVSITDDDLPVVNIAVTDADATEANGNSGLFTVTLSPPVSRSTTVAFLIGGTATSGSDYGAVAANVIIPPQTSQATILIAPVNDDRVEGDEATQITLTSGSGYTLGTPSSATITIADSTPPPEDESDSACGLGGIGFIVTLMLLSLAARRRFS